MAISCSASFTMIPKQLRRLSRFNWFNSSVEMFNVKEGLPISLMTGIRADLGSQSLVVVVLFM